MTHWRNTIERHPHLTAWAALAAGMVVVLLAALRDVALRPAQVGVLAVSTVALAGLCVWIIAWEEE
ncbi:MAG: hypothetical protein NTZ05_22360 [Chloroflexi bacterium]|nr:hypothetical protein [Chloroflexota bacterium]